MTEKPPDYVPPQIVTTGTYDPEKDVMSASDLAAYLQVSKRKIYNMATQGKIPAVKIGRQWRFYKPVIDHWRS